MPYAPWYRVRWLAECRLLCVGVGIREIDGALLSLNCGGGGGGGEGVPRPDVVVAEADGLGTAD